MRTRPRYPLQPLLDAMPGTENSKLRVLRLSGDLASGWRQAWLWAERRAA